MSSYYRDYGSYGGYGSYGSLSSAFGTIGYSLVSNLFSLAAAVMMIIGLWKMFVKAGEAGWAAIVPYYNNYILCKLSGRVKLFWGMLIAQIAGTAAAVWMVYTVFVGLFAWTFSGFSSTERGSYGGVLAQFSVAVLVLFAAGIVTIVFRILVCVSLARSFGLGGGWAVGLIFVPVVFYCIIAFSENIRYVGPDGVPAQPWQPYGQDPYSQTGYNQNPYSQAGYNQDPYNQAGYNQNPYSQAGYNQDSYNQAGYNQDPYNQTQYSQNQYNQAGYNPQYDQNAYSQNAYSQNAYSPYSQNPQSPSGQAAPNPFEQPKPSPYEQPVSPYYSPSAPDAPRAPEPPAGAAQDLTSQPPVSPYVHPESTDT